MIKTGVPAARAIISVPALPGRRKSVMTRSSDPMGCEVASSTEPASSTLCPCRSSNRRSSVRMMGSSSTRRISLMRLPRILSRGYPRQEDAHRRARSLFALDLYEAPVLSDDAVHQREAQTCALARHLGGKERVEDAVAHVAG